jgi:purine nucleoside permease
VLQCDTTSGDTRFSGRALGQRARDWVALLTDGAGTYCTTQQEDSASYEVLKRASAAGRLDVARVAVLRGGWRALNGDWVRCELVVAFGARPPG